jgi:putative transcriptional regulator
VRPRREWSARHRPRPDRSRISFHDLLGQLDIAPGVAPDVPIHAGGPVEPQRGFILHSTDWGGEESIQVGDRWTLTATLDILRAIAEGRGPTRWIAALGYAGWGRPARGGAARQRLVRHSGQRRELLYDCDVDNRWASAFMSAGVDTRMLTADFGTA